MRKVIDTRVNMTLGFCKLYVCMYVLTPLAYD